MSERRIYKFGKSKEYRLDLDQHLLFRQGENLHIAEAPKVRELLEFLITKSPSVTKQEVIDELWPKNIDPDDAYKKVFRALCRKKLNDPKCDEFFEREGDIIRWKATHAPEKVSADENEDQLSSPEAQEGTGNTEHESGNHETSTIASADTDEDKKTGSSEKPTEESKKTSEPEFGIEFTFKRRAPSLLQYFGFLVSGFGFLVAVVAWIPLKLAPEFQSLDRVLLFSVHPEILMVAGSVILVCGGILAGDYGEQTGKSARLEALFWAVIAGWIWAATKLPGAPIAWAENFAPIGRKIAIQLLSIAGAWFWFSPFAHGMRRYRSVMSIDPDSVISRKEVWRESTGLRFVERLKKELVFKEDLLFRFASMRSWLFSEWEVFEAGKSRYNRGWLLTERTRVDSILDENEKAVDILKGRINKILSGKFHDEIIQIQVDIQKLRRRREDVQSQLRVLWLLERQDIKKELHELDSNLIELEADLAELQAFEMQDRGVGSGENGKASSHSHIEKPLEARELLSANAPPLDLPKVVQDSPRSDTHRWTRDPAKFGLLTKAYFRWRFRQLPADFDPVKEGQFSLELWRIGLCFYYLEVLVNLWFSRQGLRADYYRFFSEATGIALVLTVATYFISVRFGKQTFAFVIASLATTCGASIGTCIYGYTHGELSGTVAFQTALQYVLGNFICVMLSVGYYLSYLKDWERIELKGNLQRTKKRLEHNTDPLGLVDPELNSLKELGRRAKLVRPELGHLTDHAAGQQLARDYPDSDYADLARRQPRIKKKRLVT